MHDLDAMFFTSHVNVSTLAQDEDDQTGKDHEGERDFPHAISPKKTPGNAGVFKNLFRSSARVGQNHRAFASGNQSSA